MNTEWLHIHCTPHYSPIWVCRSIPNRTVCFLYVLKRSIQTVFWYVGQCPCYSTPLKFSSRCLFNTPIEIQDPNRGPSPPQAHGVSGWGSAGWHHERQGQLLADAGGVSGKGGARSGEARRHRQINRETTPDLFYITHLLCSVNESCHQVWIYGFELWRVLGRFCIMCFIWSSVTALTYKCNRVIPTLQYMFLSLSYNKYINFIIIFYIYYSSKVWGL